MMLYAVLGSSWPGIQLDPGSSTALMTAAAVATLTSGNGPPNPQVYRPFCHHDSSSRSCSIAASSPALTSSSLPYGASATR